MPSEAAAHQPPRMDVLAYFEDRLPAMIDAIKMLVEHESPSSDANALEACASALDRYITAMLGTAPTWHRTNNQGAPHLHVDLGVGPPEVVLIGHFDTVHPTGTLAGSPARTENDHLYGPGVLDMKTGVVIMIEVARYLNQVFDNAPVRLFLNSDEELGSASSSPFLRELAAGCDVALVFESTSSEGILKTAARGVRDLRVTAIGRAGHAAYPEDYVNPVEAIGDIVVGARQFHRPAEGVVISATMIEGATAPNAVAESAFVHFSVRGSSEALLDEAEEAIRSLRPHDPRITLNFETLWQVQTLEMRDDNRAFALAQEATLLLGFPSPTAIEARGASDANQLAGIVPHALEGLGGWGNGLHDPHHEYVNITSIVPSAAMSALMVELALDEQRPVQSL